jgi:hypothetical protein
LPFSTDDGDLPCQQGNYCSQAEEGRPTVPPECMQDKNGQRGSDRCQRPFNLKELMCTQLRADRTANPEKLQDRSHRNHQQYSGCLFGQSPVYTANPKSSPKRLP